MPKPEKLTRTSSGVMPTMTAAPPRQSRSGISSIVALQADGLERVVGAARDDGLDGGRDVAVAAHGVRGAEVARLLELRVLDVDRR